MAGAAALRRGPFRACAPVTAFQQDARVTTALAINRRGTLCVAWVDPARPGWQGPFPFGSTRLLSHTAVAVFRQRE